MQEMKMEMQAEALTYTRTLGLKLAVSSDPQGSTWGFCLREPMRPSAPSAFCDARFLFSGIWVVSCVWHLYIENRGLPWRLSWWILNTSIPK